MLRILLACAAVCCVVLTPLGSAAAVKGTVRGAEVVNVRRGPGPSTVAFAALPKGSTVAVEHVAGGWALVVLQNGERGYVNAAFLDLPPDVPILPVDTPAAETTAAPAPTGGPTPAATEVYLQEQLSRVLERVAALESAMSTPSAVPRHEDAPAAGRPESPAAAEPTPMRVAEPAVPPVDDAADLRGIGPALALAGVGLVIGFLIGAAYGQRQERKRRSRVRF